MTTLLTVALLAWFGLMLIEFVWAQRLTRYRLDIEHGTPFWRGRSLFTQFNVSRLANYAPEAHGKVRWFLLLSLVRVVVAIGFFVLLGQYLFEIWG